MSNKYHIPHKTSSPNPATTFSSSLLNHIYLSIDGDSSPSPLDSDRKTSTLRRSRLVQKWMDKPTPKLPRPGEAPPVSAAVDDDPDSFFSTTSVSSSDSSLFSSTASEAETPSFNASSKPRNSCFGPPRAPKPVKTTLKGKSEETISEDECPTNKSSSSSRAVKIYSQLKNLKQPISPGLKLAKYINSLFAKESSSSSKKKKSKIKNVAATPKELPRKFREIAVPERKFKSEQTSPVSSFSGSSLTSRHLPTNSGFSSSSSSALPKRTVRFCPVVDEEGERDFGMKMGRESLTKRYEELRRMTNISRMQDGENGRKVLEEVALDLLNDCWKRSKDDGDVDINGGADQDAGDSSCSSSDLFELDHLSILGNEELPVYETTNLYC